MKFIDNKGITNPYINLAIEEYLLNNFAEEETYLLFYINEPSIIIGRNQNTIEEINTSYVEDNNIKVVRRLSGDRKSTRLNSSHVSISYAVFCLKKKKKKEN